MNMRELVIDAIKKNIDWVNQSNSWRDNYTPKEYPDFEVESDEALFKIYDNAFKGPCG